MPIKYATAAEKEVERLLLEILPNSPFAHKAFAVGGYVRDELLGLQSKDLDIVVEIPDGGRILAEYIHDLFPEETSSPRKLGAGYPIWGISFKKNIEYNGKVYNVAGADLDIADTQTEVFPDAMSRQREVQYGTLDEDVRRRDFTVNMLMKDLTNGQIVDLSGTGVEDLKNGVLRHFPAVSPDDMFSNDPLRMLRLVRFMSKYGWDAHPELFEAVKRNAHRINIVSEERIRDELIKIMKLGKLEKAIRFMADTGLLKYILPEVADLIGVAQDKTYHAEGDVFEHTMRVLEKAKPTIEAQLAALLHDVGKKDTQEFIEDKIRFFGHEKVSGEIAEAVLRRLRFDNSTVKKVRKLVENHMRPHFSQDWNNKTVRKFLLETIDYLDDLLDLAEIDALSSLTPSGEPSKNIIPELRQRIEEQRSFKTPTKLPISGKDIMSVLGLSPGPEVGKILNYVKDVFDEWASEGRTMTKEEAIEVIKQYKDNVRAGIARVYIADTSDLLRLSRQILDRIPHVSDKYSNILTKLYRIVVALYRASASLAMGDEVSIENIETYIDNFDRIVSHLFLINNRDQIQQKKDIIESLLGTNGVGLLLNAVDEIDNIINIIETKTKAA